MSHGTDNRESYEVALGARLRAIRTQQGYSLHGIEEKSRGKWKAVVVGSWERADRSITVQKLSELADFYDVDIADMLPGAAPVAPWGAGRRKAAAHAAARAVLNAIPAVIDGLPKQEFECLADQISAGVRGHMEAHLSAKYEATIAELRTQLAAADAGLIASAS